QWDAFEQDLVAGKPPYVLFARHALALCPITAHDNWLVPLMQVCQRAGFGNFRYLGQDPPFREEPFPGSPTAAEKMDWQGDTGQVINRDSSLLFTLDRPKYVGGIRITYSHAVREGVWIRMYWKRSDQKDFPATEQFTFWPLPAAERGTQTMWVGETIDQFRIH